MICVVDEKNIIVNVVDGDDITENNQKKGFPWSRLWEEYTTEKPADFAKKEFDELKVQKIAEFKVTRDTLEIEPIEYGGHLYDYDEKARDRINAAIIALDLAGADAKLSWTTADQKEAVVGANDLRGIIANVAVRSNTLHVKYRDLKQEIENTQTKEELEKITWNEDVEEVGEVVDGQ